MGTEHNQHFTFEEIFHQNKKRIHYYIHKMNIKDPHEDFFQEGLVALWNAYKTYQPNKGPMATYFNYTIRNRLIDKLRKDVRSITNDSHVIIESTKQMNNGNHFRRNNISYPLPDLTGIEADDRSFWKKLKANLTDKQWKWVYYYILHDLSIKEIARIEQTTEDAVKSWGKQVRKKLQDKKFHNLIEKELK